MAKFVIPSFGKPIKVTPKNRKSLKIAGYKFVEFSPKKKKSK